MTENQEKPAEGQGKSRSGMSLQAILAAVAGVIVAITGLVTALQTFSHGHDDAAETTSAAPTAAPVITPTESPPPVTTPPTSALPVTAPLNSPSFPSGADVLGWLDSFARCDAPHAAAAIASTKQSRLVLCQAAPGAYYYRGVRRDSGETIELPNGVRSTDGFDVVNPVDGTKYEIRRDALTFVKDGEVLGSEQIQVYWPRD
jgi:hypothetical protein